MPGRQLTSLAARLDRLLPDRGYPRTYPWRKVYVAVLAGADLAAVALAFFLAYALNFWALGKTPESDFYLPALGLLLAGTFFALKALGRYEDRRLMREASDLGEVLAAVSLAFAAVVVVAYAAKAKELSRLFLGSYLLLALFLVPLARRQLKLLRMRLRASGLDLTRVIVLGHNPTAETLLGKLTAHAEWPLTPIAVVGDQWAGRWRSGVRVLRGEHGLERYLRVSRADEVIVCKPEAPIEELAMLLADLKRLGVRSRVVSHEFEVLRTKLGLPFDEVGGIPVIDFPLRPFRGWRAGLKRTVDIGGASLVLLLGLPVWVLIGLAVLVTSGRPIFFLQERVGRDGRPFRMFKFRTMRSDGGGSAVEGRPAGNVMRGPMLKIPGDRRVTWIGRWLRRFSIDEMPQILNVLRGEMSLVGPRPPIPAEVRCYKPWHRLRLEGRMGMTGLWQIFGRDLLDFDHVVAMDIYYLSQGSLFLDYRIMLKTAAVVLSGRPDPREAGRAQTGAGAKPPDGSDDAPVSADASRAPSEGKADVPERREAP
jgi:exopolysaccharide biosynthesis polyprenyl glycosylphosphotransferase